MYRMQRISDCRIVGGVGAAIDSGQDVCKVQAISGDRSVALSEPQMNMCQLFNLSIRNVVIIRIREVDLTADTHALC
jgi:hypothetical protein